MKLILQIAKSFSIPEPQEESYYKQLEEALRRKVGNFDEIILKRTRLGWEFPLIPYKIAEMAVRKGNILYGCHGRYSMGIEIGKMDERFFYGPIIESFNLEEENIEDILDTGLVYVPDIKQLKNSHDEKLRKAVSFLLEELVGTEI